MSSRSPALGRRRVLALLAALALLPASAAAQAPSLDAARRQGLVGEQGDGFVGAPRGAPTVEIAALIQSVNAERRRIYQARAAEQKVSWEPVGRVYAQQIMRDLPPGSWIRPDGAWMRK